jgi:hypothetical protein
MKTIKIALTCLLVLASLPGISQPVHLAPANATASLGGPMAMGSANDLAIQKLNMELTKTKAEFAQELAKLKKDIAAVTNELASHQFAYSKHTHEYVRSSNDFFPAKAKCGWGGKECDPVIWYDVYKPRYETTLVSKPQ